MADAPWLTIIGLGEDGPAGLSPASHAALAGAEIVTGPARHLDLLGDIGAEVVVWPVPFADGVAPLLAMRGRQVVVLASGDPFWFGAGSVLARHLDPGEWRALPGVSCLSLAAARLGWALETCRCVALHAAPFARLRADLWSGARLIVTLRDGQAVSGLGAYLAGLGFGESRVWVMEALGGPREKVTEARADALEGCFAHPVCAAVEVAGGPGLPLASGLPDEVFDHDGQITKRPVRALTLSALAPRPGEYLWDIGGGSGSIAIEWLLRHPAMRATSFERDPARAARIAANAAALGVERLEVVTGAVPAVLEGHAVPDVVFIGGGISEALLGTLFGTLGAGTRIVANGVTLEAEALLARWQAAKGGALMRIEISNAAPLGTRRGWKAAYPVVQWSVTL